MKDTLFNVILVMLAIGLIVQSVNVIRLERERDAYQWKNFTCKTLLDDPVTNKIMCTKWRKK